MARDKYEDEMNKPLTAEFYVEDTNELFSTVEFSAAQSDFIRKESQRQQMSVEDFILLALRKGLEDNQNSDD